MKKFLARFFIILAFIASILLVIPFADLPLLKSLADEGSKVSEIAIKTVYVPIAIAAISLLFFIIGMFEKGRKGHISRPVVRATYHPLGMYALAALLLGVYRAVQTADYGAFEFSHCLLFKLEPIAKVLKSIINALALGGSPHYGFINLCVVLMLLTFIFVTFLTRKLYKRNFFLRFLVLLFLAIFAFVARELSVLAFRNTYKSLANLFNLESFLFWLVASLLLIGLIYFIIIGIRWIKAGEPEDVTDKVVPDKKTPEEVQTKEVEVPEEIKIDEPLFVLPEPEEVLETVVEEKTVVREVVYEPSDLDELFNTKFGFRYCTKVVSETKVDYYVNKLPFLTFRNNYKEMSFRLELDKAIRLIIQFPLVGKDKYENHKIWFKLENLDVLSKDKVIEIIKEAYETVLNNK